MTGQLYRRGAKSTAHPKESVLSFFLIRLLPAVMKTAKLSSPLPAVFSPAMICCTLRTRLIKSSSVTVLLGCWLWCSHHLRFELRCVWCWLKVRRGSTLATERVETRILLSDIRVPQGGKRESHCILVSEAVYSGT